MSVKVGSKAVETGVETIEKEFTFDDFQTNAGDVAGVGNAEAGNFKPVSAKRNITFPSKTMKAEDSDDFFKCVGELEGDDWKRISIYLYRQWPLINRQVNDPTEVINIDKFGRPFTEEDILETHGGGRYKVLVNDSEKAIKGKGGSICTAYFNFVGSDYPQPKILLHELILDHKDNRSYVDKLKSEGKLTSDGKVASMIPTTTGGNDPQIMTLLTELIRNRDRQAPTTKDATTENLSSMFVKTHEASINMLKDQMKGDDPEKWIKLAALLLPLINKPDTSADMFGNMMKLQADSQAREKDLMLKMMDIVQAKAVVPETNSRMQMMEEFQMMKELFGGEGHVAKKSTFETAFEHGAPIVGKILDGVLGFLSIQKYKATMEGQARTVQQQPVQTQVEQPMQVEGEKVVEMPVDPKLQELRTLLTGQAGRLILGALDRNTPGDAFAESVCNMFGNNTFNKIQGSLKESGVEQIIAGAKQIPEFWQHVGSEEALSVFLTEFVEFDPLAVEDEEDAK